MRTSAAGLCPTTAAAAGMVIDYIGAYPEASRGLVRASTGLGDSPQIVAVIDGGPADAAGVEAGDEIVAVGDRTIEEMLRSAEDPALLADDIQDLIAAYPADGSVALSMRRGEREFAVQVAPARACSARFILKTGSRIEAYSDGDSIAVTTATVRFAANDDELALVTGHELAHVIDYGGEPAGLFGRRKMEDRADVLGARLARCAGYDVERSLAFWRRFASRDWLGWLRGPTHRSAQARYELLSKSLTETPCTERRRDFPACGPKVTGHATALVRSGHHWADGAGRWLQDQADPRELHGQPRSPSSW